MLHRLLTGIVRLTAPNADLRTMAGTAEGALILGLFAALLSTSINGQEN